MCSNARGMGPAYPEALAIERKTSQMVNLGLLKHGVTAPPCTLMDIFEGEYHPLFPPSGPRAPTMMIFWGQWCHSSRKLISWFVKFARMNKASKVSAAVPSLLLLMLISTHLFQYDFVAIHMTQIARNPPKSTLSLGILMAKLS